VACGARIVTRRAVSCGLRDAMLASKQRKLNVAEKSTIKMRDHVGDESSPQTETEIEFSRAAGDDI